MINKNKIQNVLKILDERIKDLEESSYYCSENVGKLAGLIFARRLIEETINDSRKT